MSKTQNLVSNCFRREKTFAQVEKEVDRYLRNAQNEQLSLFDLIGG